MVTAQQFLTDFTKDIVHDIEHRPELVAGWAKHLEAREVALRIEAYEDCGSKGGDGKVVRSYAKAQAQKLKDAQS